MENTPLERMCGFNGYSVQATEADCVMQIFSRRHTCRVHGRHCQMSGPRLVIFRVLAADSVSISSSSEYLPILALFCPRLAYTRVYRLVMPLRCLGPLISVLHFRVYYRCPHQAHFLGLCCVYLRYFTYPKSVTAHNITI